MDLKIVLLPLIYLCNGGLTGANRNEALLPPYQHSVLHRIFRKLTFIWKVLECPK